MAAVSAINTWSLAVGFVTRRARHTAPLVDAELRDTPAGLRRDPRRVPAQASPLRTSDVASLLTAVDVSPTRVSRWLTCSTRRWSYWPYSRTARPRSWLHCRTVASNPT